MNTIVREQKSPNGSLIATVYKRDCGATTAENTQVSIRSKGEAFDPNKQSSIFVAETDGNVVIVWENDLSIAISFAGDSEVFRQEYRSGGVTIAYSKRP